MKKPTLRDISDKLDIIEGKLDEVLRRIAPRPLPEKTQIIARNEPEDKPSPHRASLAARSNECVHQLTAHLDRIHPTVRSLIRTWGPYEA